jgi:oxalate decarboxylase
MHEFSRRNLLGAAATGSLIAAASATDALANGQPQWGPTPPVLAGAQLPSFRFQLGAVAPKRWQGGWAKEATVAEFPVSEKLAGVLMSLVPGGLRELHWHANAAEWAYMIKGQCRVTTIDPNGHSEIVDFGPGDVWYFPRGHGHSIQSIGREDCLFVLVFDNGYFSEFGTFSITDWIGHTPKALLAKNFGLPESAFETMPKEEVYFARGKPPPAEPSVPLQGWKLPPETHKYRLLAQPPHATYRGGREWRVDSTRFPIAKTITGVILDLDPGALRTLHWHPNADEWQYVLEGEVSVTLFGSHGRYRTEQLQKGDVGYIPQGYGHSIENTGEKPVRILIGFNAGKYETIDLSQWVAANPKDVLATNFGQPAELFEKFPDRDVFIASGKGAGK